MLKKKIASETNINQKRGSFLSVKVGEASKVLEGLI